MLRKEILEKIRKNIKRRRSILIVGRKGAGKTWLLKQLEGIYIEFPLMHYILEQIVFNLHLKTKTSPKYMSIPSLYKICRKKLNKLTILIDDLHTARRPLMNILEKMILDGAVIIGASEKSVFQSLFYEVINLESMTREEILEMLNSFKIKDKNTLDIIFSKSLGFPGKAVELAKQYKIGLSNKEIKKNNLNSLVRYFMELKPSFPERVDLFPLWLLFIVGFGAFAFKVLLYSEDRFRDGYTIAMFGYLALIIYKAVRRR